MNLSESLLYVTARMEGQVEHGISTGTGFFYLCSERLFLVTNKHVVRGVTSGRILIHRKENLDDDAPIPGASLEVTFTESDFFGHSDPEVDIAIAEFTGGFNALGSQNLLPFVKWLTSDSVPNHEQMEHIGPIEDILIVGYPNGIWDSSNNFPIVRQGVTATAFGSDFNGKQQFLVDASVFPGSSGSPVFLYNAGGFVDHKTGTFMIGSGRFHFLGIIASVFYQNTDGRIVIEDIPAVAQPIARIQQMIDLGVVFKSILVEETCQEFIHR